MALFQLNEPKLKTNVYGNRAWLKIDIKQIVGSIDVNQFAPKFKLVDTNNEEFLHIGYGQTQQQELRLSHRFEWKLMSLKAAAYYVNNPLHSTLPLDSSFYVMR